MSHSFEIRQFFAGAFHEGTGPQSVPTVDPATRQHLANVSSASAADVREAVEAARGAARAWAATAPRQRGEVLDAVADGIRRRSKDLARMESLDTGKPLTQSLADVAACADYFGYYATILDKFFGETINVSATDLGVVIREPLGVIAHITPWNYPLQVLGRSVAPALAAGNVSIVKPAEEAPLSSLELGHIALEAGVPEGVLSVLAGPGAQVGGALAASPDIDHVVFTGSVATGALVMTAAAANLTSVTMELGGKSPAVICADADLDAAVPVIAKALLQNAGQSCSACTRVIIEQSIYEGVLARLASVFEAARLGHGIEDPDLGPVISDRQAEQVLSTIEETIASGARLICGGRRVEVDGLPGAFVAPTILADVDPNSAAAQEEIFGPVLIAMPFDGDIRNGAILADHSPYGLVASIWTSDVNKALAFVRQVQFGQVFVNSYGVGGGVALPFGGFKKSGFGREKGVDAMREYTQAKTVLLHGMGLGA